MDWTVYCIQSEDEMVFNCSDQKPWLRVDCDEIRYVPVCGSCEEVL